MNGTTTPVCQTAASLYWITKWIVCN